MLCARTLCRRSVQFNSQSSSMATYMNSKSISSIFFSIVTFVWFAYVKNRIGEAGQIMKNNHCDYSLNCWSRYDITHTSTLDIVRWMHNTIDNWWTVLTAERIVAYRRPQRMGIPELPLFLLHIVSTAATTLTLPSTIIRLQNAESKRKRTTRSSSA